MLIAIFFIVNITRLLEIYGLTITLTVISHMCLAKTFSHKIWHLLLSTYTQGPSVLSGGPGQICDMGPSMVTFQVRAKYFLVWGPIEFGALGQIAPACTVIDLSIKGILKS